MAESADEELELEDVAHETVFEENFDDPERIRELKLRDEGERLAHFYLIDSGQLLDSASLTPDFLIEGALTRASVNMIVGRPGTSKSWLGYDAALAILHNREWLGFEPPNVVSPTALILNYDNPPAELARRFLRLGLKRSDNAYFHSLGAHTPPEGLPYVLQLPDTYPQLEALIFAIKPDIVLIDSHRQAHLFDDNDNQAMAIVMGSLRRLATMSNAAIVAIHHTRKDGDALRGATEIEAGLDCAIMVEDGVTSWIKTRGWEMLEPSRTFDLEDVGDSTVVVAGPTLSSALRGGPLPRTVLAKRLGLSPQSLGPILKRAVATGLVEESRSGGEWIVKLAE